MRYSAILAAALIVAFAAGCAGSPRADAGGCADCAAVKIDGQGWCDGCQKGVVGGEEARCKSCYQGKTGQNVWCKGCKKGFVNGKTVKCEGCYTAVNGGSSCSRCSK